MGKNCLKQILTYINKVYDVGEKINTFKNKNQFPVKISTISSIVLFSFIMQIRSFKMFIVIAFNLMRLYFLDV